MTEMDLGELRSELRKAVRGEVAFDVTARALTTMDASNYRRVPLGVVAPRDADDVAAALSVCSRLRVPVVARGGGTSIAGQATGTGVVLDFTRHMNRVVSLDAQARTAVVQPGVVLDRLQETAAPHGLRFGPDPSTHSRCTLGGMIGNNSCGSNSVAWGTTADSVRELSVVTARGEFLSPGRSWSGAPEGLRALVEGELGRLRTGFPDLPRRISGYALDALLPEKGADVARSFCGSEGTLGVLTEAVVALVEAPRARALAVLAYADESAAAEAAAGLLPYGPLTVEGMAADLVRADAGLPRGGAWLFVETGGGTAAEARARADAIVRAADVVDSLVVTDPAGRRALWRVREDASGTATRMPDGTEAWPGWEDCAVPPARLGPYLRDFRGLLTSHGLRGTPYGHFGDGCIHVRIDFDLLSRQGIGRFRRFSEELAELVVAHGGSLSGEHGDGQARAELLPKMYGEEMVALFERAKAVWDPDDLLNPGMLVRPAALDENLRFAVLPREPVDVAFGYPHDGGDFSAAVRRCVGVAKCRTETAGPGSGVMCPSFRATGEEEHSTRGRARLLHEMLAGEVVTDGWASTEVRDALDLCLSCKGCRSDCPVGVDMATYKAEFLHHHYEGRRRPAAHYTMGWLPVWLATVSRLRLAGLVNFLASVRPLAAVAKRLGGIAPEREIPRVAGETFTRWWGRRARAQVRQELRAGHVEHEEHPDGGLPKTVVLWPDTFTEHLSPSVGKAATRVLEAAGLRVLPWPPGEGRFLRVRAVGGWLRRKPAVGSRQGPRPLPGRTSGDGVRGTATPQGAASPLAVPNSSAATSPPTAPNPPVAPNSPVAPDLLAAPDLPVAANPEGAASPPAAASPPDAENPSAVPNPPAAPNSSAVPNPLAASDLTVAQDLPTAPDLAAVPRVAPRGRVCCGLTYVSTGQLDRARKVMRRTLDLLYPLGDPSVPGEPPPIVVLEPSCAAALRTDLPELLPDDPRAQRVASAVLTFAEVLERHAPHWTPPRLDRPVVGQTHCHQHAILGDAPDRRLRTAAGLTGELSGGCCGLAGNFGFEKGHYEVSVACAEEQLLPAVRAAGEEPVVLADGFSCRTQLEQLEQLGGRKGRHLAEVLAEGLDDSEN
ncbi:FAD-linked oxidase C-terminal domain-containing protein [Streptomyces phaeochromogenes]|uniref:FAD-binding and (Fe-S)-binding domain-containing protein n=1 Tax=Streptomyces phaeochromogenes TaxID=1923 RepID=UPI003868575A|nr:FAD-binding protein [Streptomyces phaeochromogenes]